MPIFFIKKLSYLLLFILTFIPLYAAKNKKNQLNSITKDSVNNTLFPWENVKISPVARGRDAFTNLTKSHTSFFLTALDPYPVNDEWLIDENTACMITRYGKVEGNTIVPSTDGKAPSLMPFGRTGDFIQLAPSDRTINTGIILATSGQYNTLGFEIYDWGNTAYPNTLYVAIADVEGGIKTYNITLENQSDIKKMMEMQASVDQGYSALSTWGFVTATSQKNIDFIGIVLGQKSDDCAIGGSVWLGLSKPHYAFVPPFFSSQQANAITESPSRWTELSQLSADIREMALTQINTSLQQSSQSAMINSTTLSSLISSVSSADLTANTPAEASFNDMVSTHRLSMQASPFFIQHLDKEMIKKNWIGAGRFLQSYTQPIMAIGFDQSSKSISKSLKKNPSDLSLWIKPLFGSQKKAETKTTFSGTLFGVSSTITPCFTLNILTGLTQSASVSADQLTTNKMHAWHIGASGTYTKKGLSFSYTFLALRAAQEKKRAMPILKLSAENALKSTIETHTLLLSYTLPLFSLKDQLSLSLLGSFSWGNYGEKASAETGGGSFAMGFTKTYRHFIRKELGIEALKIMTTQSMLNAGFKLKISLTNQKAQSMDILPFFLDDKATFPLKISKQNDLYINLAPSVIIMCKKWELSLGLQGSLGKKMHAGQASFQLIKYF